MMYLREKLNIGYIKDLKTQILELPYIGNISMFLLLPDEIEDFIHRLGDAGKGNKLR